MQKAKVVKMANWKGEKIEYPKGPLNLARSYNFIDKHPCVDEIRTWIQDDPHTVNWIASRANLSHSCVKNLLEGQTKRPQNATIDMIGKVFGKKRVWVDDK